MRHEKGAVFRLISCIKGTPGAVSSLELSPRLFVLIAAFPSLYLVNYFLLYQDCLEVRTPTANLLLMNQSILLQKILIFPILGINNHSLKMCDCI